MKKFGGSLSSSDFRFARAVEAAGLATISQAVKALERNEPIVKVWEQKLYGSDDVDSATSSLDIVSTVNSSN